ncbi:YALIA101S11e00122g1_1 [Yarrowia lipolytica]|nr:mRNA 3'-end-processing protein RNA14 [Yarrowia lipolytica]SEI36277.1 YALIA101S11e00122g1_1 [Yarrowia lipolytica]
MSDDYDPTAVAFKPGDMETDMNTGEPLALEAEAAAKDPAHNEESGEDTNANVESGTLVHQGDEPDSIDKEDKVEDGPDTKSDGGVLDEPKDGEQRDDEKREEPKPENSSEEVAEDDDYVPAAVSEPVEEDSAGGGSVGGTGIPDGAISSLAASTTIPPPSDPNQVGGGASSTSNNNNSGPDNNKRKRLATDTIGILEDRIAANPRDMPAWLDLISTIVRKEKLDESRDIYERFLALYPLSAEIWIEYITLEMDNGEFKRLEQLFGRCLTRLPNLKLWNIYLTYVRRVNVLSSESDKITEARTNIIKAFEFYLDHVGIDRESGNVWFEYLDFIKSKPATTTWEEQQKNDLTRKIYRKAIGIPLNNLSILWTAYTNFEYSLNKATARKFINEKSGSCQNARQCQTVLENLMRGLDRSSVPKSGPRDEFQVRAWKKWIDWEKSNPLGTDNKAETNKRLLYCLKQAVMSLQFVPEIWFLAAEYCFDDPLLKTEALQFLKDGLSLNPNSSLLAFRLAEYYEREADAEKMRTIYDEHIESLGKERQALIEAQGDPEAEPTAEIIKLNTQISIAYSVCMKAVKRFEGIKPGRMVFKKARNTGFATYHIYVASALMEFHHNKNPTVATNVFELGLKYCGSNAAYVQHYLDFLISLHDDTNARALFEKTIPLLGPSDAASLIKSMIKFESDFGEITSVVKLQDRLRQLNPDTSPITIIADRFATSDFDVIRQCDMLQKPKSRTDEDSDSERPSKRARRTSHGNDQGDKMEPFNLPQKIDALLRQLPNSSDYGEATFDPQRLVDLFRDVRIPDGLL